MYAASCLQPLTTPDSLLIFKAGRVYTYQAIFVSSAGDTLTRQRVTLTASGQPWKVQPKVQTAFTVAYAYSPQDSLAFSSYHHPESKSPDKPKRYVWSRTETTGAKENKQEVWMHPIRGNQYSYTEVAPFPQVLLDSLQISGTWQNTTSILMGWGAFKGKTVNRYRVDKQQPRQYGNLTLPACWLVHAVARHSKLGNSYLDFYFHPEYGFTEMHYRLYDGTTISFVLETAT